MPAAWSNGPMTDWLPNGGWLSKSLMRSSLTWGYPAWTDTPCCRRSVPATTARRRSEEHTSELQSLMRISYAVFCLKKKTNKLNIAIKKNNEHQTNNNM